MPSLENNEIKTTPPRNPSAIRWFIGGILALIILTPYIITMAIIGWTHTAVAWNGLRIAVGF